MTDNKQMIVDRGDETDDQPQPQPPQSASETNEMQQRSQTIGSNDGKPMQMAVFPEQQQSIQDQLMEISQTVPVKSTISLDNNNTFCMESSSFQIQALNVADTKDWHKSITRDHRSFLLQKLLQTQSPIPNPSDRRIQNLIVHIKRVESKMFEVANSKSEYYQLWVKRVDRLRQGLEERRSKRNEQRDQQAENHHQRQHRQHQHSSAKTSNGSVQRSQPENVLKKRKQCQQLLLWLFHAYACEKREKNQSNDKNANRCTRKKCKPMREVVNHIRQNRNCTANCSVPFCKSARRILYHWKSCTRSDCAVCSPYRRPNRENCLVRRTQNLVRHYKECSWANCGMCNISIYLKQKLCGTRDSIRTCRLMKNKRDYQSAFVNHSCHCHNAACTNAMCIIMRTALSHINACQKKIPKRTDSKLCQEVFTFCVRHINICSEPDCIFVTKVRAQLANVI